ncbi:MAG: CPBP family intramembrane metalloprotease [Cyclobacteriaceae bacterium]|nr:CPBP family intramembrane metalloprotease [Cyclobacteriaceae bacterium]
MLEFISKNLIWNNEAKAALIIMIGLIGFLSFWFISNSENIKNYFQRKYPSGKASEVHFIFGKTIGFLFIAMVPAMICKLTIPEFEWAEYGLIFHKEKTLYSILSILVLALIGIPIVYRHSKSPETLKKYPQIRARLWTWRTVITEIGGWVLYLFGYEFLFRGIMLLLLSNLIGILPSIAINTALYSATHIPKGREETIGAIPIGILFSFLTLYSESIWIAFTIHLIISMTNFYGALKHNPEIKWEK